MSYLILKNHRTGKIQYITVKSTKEEYKEKSYPGYSKLFTTQSLEEAKKRILYASRPK